MFDQKAHTLGNNINNDNSSDSDEKIYRIISVYCGLKSENKMQ